MIVFVSVADHGKEEADIFHIIKVKMLERKYIG